MSFLYVCMDVECSDFVCVHGWWCVCTGQPVSGNISEVPLKAGDVLVVEAGPEFLHNFKNNRAFSLISEVPNSSPLKRSKMWIVSTRFHSCCQ